MTHFQLSQAIEILEQTPATVRSLLGNLSDEWIFTASQKDNWNPFDVIGHYINADETNWLPRAEIILKQGADTAFKGFDRYAQFETSKDKTLSELLQKFAEVRQNSLETLKSWNLTAEQLQFKGIHPEFGEVTLEQLLATWVVHDLTHIRQIAIILAKNYSETVGPWKAYLSILQ